MGRQETVSDQPVSQDHGDHISKLNFLLGGEPVQGRVFISVEKDSQIHCRSFAAIGFIRSFGSFLEAARNMLDGFLLGDLALDAEHGKLLPRVGVELPIRLFVATPRQLPPPQSVSQGEPSLSRSSLPPHGQFARYHLASSQESILPQVFRGEQLQD